MRKCLPTSKRRRRTVKGGGYMKNARRRVVLRTWLGKGCAWLRRIDIYVHSGMTDATVHKHLRKDVVPALMPCLLPLFPRHRWVGIDRTYREATLKSGLYDLLVQLIILLVQWIRAKTKKPPAIPAPEEIPGFIVDATCRHDFSEAPPSDADDAEQDAGEASLRAQGAEAGPSVKVEHVKINKQNRTTSKRWAESQPRGRVAAQMVCWEPVQDYMQAFLWMCGPDFDETGAAEAARSKGVSSRAMEIHSAKLEINFAQAVKQRMTSAEDWEVVPPPHRTIGLRGLAFRLSQRIAGAVFSLLFLTARGCPFIAFATADGTEESARKLHDLPECLREEFAEWWLELFPDVADLTGERAQTTMEVISHFLRFDLTRIEARHGSMQAELRARSLGLTAQDSIHVRTAFITRRTCNVADGHFASMFAVQQAEVAAQPKAAGRPKKKAPKRGRVRERALKWKYYVSVRSSERREERRRLGTKGKFGSKVFEGLGGRDFTDFCRNPNNFGERFESAKAAYQQGQSWRTSTAQQSAPARVRTAAAMARGEEVPADVASVLVGSAASNDEEYGTIMPVVDAGDVSAKLKEIWHQRRDIGRQERTDKNEKKKVIKQRCDLLQRDVPLPECLSTIDGQVVRIAGNHVTHSTVIPPVREQIESFLKNTNPASRVYTGQGGDVGIEVNELPYAWRHFTDAAEVQAAVLKHEDSTPLGQVPQTKRLNNPCWCAQMCLCGRPILKGFLELLTSVFRRLFKTKTPERRLLDEGRVVFKMVWFEAIDDGSEQEAADLPESTDWVHIADQNLTTWAMSLTRLHPDEDPDEVALAELHGFTPLALPGCLMEIPGPWEALGLENGPRFCDGFPFEHRGVISFYEVVEDDIKIDAVIPGHVAVRRSTSAVLQPQPLWPGSVAYQRLYGDELAMPAPPIAVAASRKSKSSDGAAGAEGAIVLVPGVGDPEMDDVEPVPAKDRLEAMLAHFQPSDADSEDSDLGPPPEDGDGVAAEIAAAKRLKRRRQTLRPKARAKRKPSSPARKGKADGSESELGPRDTDAEDTDASYGVAVPKGYRVRAIDSPEGKRRYTLLKRGAVQWRCKFHKSEGCTKECGFKPGVSEEEAVRRCLLWEADGHDMDKASHCFWPGGTFLDYYA